MKCMYCVYHMYIPYKYIDIVVRTVYTRSYTSLEVYVYICRYVQVHTDMYNTCVLILRTYHVHVLYMSVWLVSSCVCNVTKLFEKLWVYPGFEPWTSCTLQGCSDHYATSVTTLTCWIYFNGISLPNSWRGLRLTWSLVSNVWRSLRPPPAPAMP